MPAKLYVVSVELEVLVLAESEDRARSFAFDAFKDDLYNQTPSDFDAKPANGYIPARWDEDCLVYGDTDGDVTVAQALAMERNGEPDPVEPDPESNLRFPGEEGLPA